MMGLNARNSDPVTSHMAEDRLAPVSARHMRKITEALWLGPGTQSEIARRCGLRCDQVWRRCSDLKRLGVIEETGERRAGDSGRLQDVYRIKMMQGRQGSLL